jgi:hypothetical protein
MKGENYDNESRGSVVASFTIIFIQSSYQTNQLSKNSYLSLLKQKNATTLNQKRHKLSIYG